MLATRQASLSRTTRTRMLRVSPRQVTSTPTVAGPSSLPETRALLTTVTSDNTPTEEGIQNRTDRLVLLILPLHCIPVGGRGSDGYRAWSRLAVDAFKRRAV